MSNFVLDRIKKQMQRSKSVGVVDAKPSPPEREEVANRVIPLSSEELRKFFMAELAGEESSVEISNPSERIFNGVEDFVNWLIPFKENFTENQQVALVTLIQAKNAINAGCACKKSQRLAQSNEYFKTFWLKNQNTDLPNKVLELGQFTSVTFAINGEPFLKVSANTP